MQKSLISGYPLGSPATRSILALPQPAPSSFKLFSFFSPLFGLLPFRQYSLDAPFHFCIGFRSRSGVEFDLSFLKHVRDFSGHPKCSVRSRRPQFGIFAPVATIFNFLHIYVGDVPSWRHPARSYRGPSAAFEKVDKSYILKRMPGSASLLRCCRINIAMAIHTFERT